MVTKWPSLLINFKIEWNSKLKLSKLLLLNRNDVEHTLSIKTEGNDSRKWVQQFFWFLSCFGCCCCCCCCFCYCCCSFVVVVFLSVQCFAVVILLFSVCTCCFCVWLYVSCFLRWSVSWCCFLLLLLLLLMWWRLLHQIMPKIGVHEITLYKG